jgi:CBS domain containing-hemolysin-like protein
MALVFVVGTNIYMEFLLGMHIYKIVYGVECAVFALLMIIFWKWTAEFIRFNLINYPFLRYVIPKNLVVRRWFVVLLAICVILFGLMVVFGPSTRVVTQSTF